VKPTDPLQIFPIHDKCQALVHVDGELVGAVGQGQGQGQVMSRESTVTSSPKPKNLQLQVSSEES
jgi:hypothetical protein